MLGTVELQDLRVNCIVGVLPRERTTQQTVALDVSMDLDFAEAVKTEDVHATVDYAETAAEIERLLVDQRFQLIETMADRTARLVLEKYPRVVRVRVVVRKPGALPQCAAACVRLERAR